ncbi:MAG: replicative DNA helicase [Candidatus Tagabacteria bacterium CG10_big_fil_rev_8_21_14_0_10_40_13]|uniref:Replicative DNA helicase n=2 Tax=Candidatus Tagaibacteriota TaxID=1817918 RepID=A0A2M8L987_9BACT|nr:MAG: replicative DNA helicase [Candidatus Tagabacteria bacterium CG10_big_fil_rev_8_21_14_0_10_40_13]
MIRIPPHNLEAEISTLGALMIHSDAVTNVIEILNPEDFYDTKHQLIYKAIYDLTQNNSPIDILSVSARLKEKKAIKKIGGSAYLTELVNSVPTASNARYYAEIVQKNKILRDLISTSDYIAQLGYQAEEDVDSLLDQAQQKIFSISKTSSNKFFELKNLLGEAWERIDRLNKSQGELRGIPTGFDELDKKLAGLQKSDLVILAARPSVGKTSLALDIARNAAVYHGIPVGIFSLEMAAHQVVDRLLAAEGHVDLWRLRNGRLSEKDGDFAKISEALERLSKAPIFIDDEPSSNILQMRSKARRLQAEHNIGLLVVDYLQLMMPRRENDSPVQQMTENSRFLKSLARELNIPVLAISQLSRAVEQRRPPIPRLSDLRDSGSIEQDADVVMFIYREDKYKKDTPKQNIAEILIEKHRNGPTGRAELYFNPEKTSFMNIEKGLTDNVLPENPTEPF